jgi:hypothetical protein
LRSPVYVCSAPGPYLLRQPGSVKWKTVLVEYYLVELLLGA